MNFRFGKLSLILKAVVLSILLSACSSHFKVQTEPEQADVSIIAEDGSREKIGQTPFTKSRDQLRQSLGERTPGELVQIEVSKEGFESKVLYLPISSSLTLSSELKVKLRPSVEDEQKEQEDQIAEKKKAEQLQRAEQILTRLFLVQKFARSKQLERALIEIDKILEVFPTFPQALTMKASIYFAQKKFSESLIWYEKAIKANPEHETAVLMAGKVRLKLRAPSARGTNR